MSERLTWRAVHDGAIEELHERLDDNGGEYCGWEDEPHDTIHEIADSHVPIYNSDRLEVVADSPDIGCRDLELAGPDMDMVTLAGIAIYEALNEALWDEYREMADNREAVADG